MKKASVIQRPSFLLKTLAFVMPTAAALGPFAPVHGQYSAFRVAAIAFILLAFFGRTPRLQAAPQLPLLIAAGALWYAFGVGGVLTSLDRSHAARSFYPVALGILLILAFTIVGSHREIVRLTFLGWVTSFVLTGMIGGWEIASHRHLSNYLSQAAQTNPDLIHVDTRMIASVFGNPNAYATYLVIVFPILYASYIFTSEAKLRNTYAALSLAALFLLLCTGGRLCVVAALIQLIVILILSGRRAPWRTLATYASALVLLVISGNVLKNFLPTKVSSFSFANIPTLVSGPSAGSGRLEIYQDGLWAITHSTGLGLGPGGFEARLATGDVPTPTFGILSPHSAFIEISADYGLPVLLAVLASLTMCALVFLRANREPQSDARAWPVACIAILIGFIPASFANSNFLPGSTNWMWLATIFLTCTFVAPKVTAKVRSSRHVERPRERATSSNRAG